MSPPADAPKKFPDFVPPTKVQYTGDHTTLRLRKCSIVYRDSQGTPRDRSFESGEIRIGAMEDNDLVLVDETVSRYHCKILQEDTGYVLFDLGSTNGTFINNVRVREAYLTPDCTIRLGQAEVTFHAGEEEVQIVPSHKSRCGDMIGGHAKLREIYAIIEKIAPSNATVVIQGETGTGKEVVAQTIHKLSERKSGELFVFDCGAVPENLIESELFGHEKGSFTGAVMTRRGLFEAADGGTLFLDEIGELPLDLQPKLLRALEQREIRRVGSNKSVKVDARILAATNRDLEVEVKAGRFREDLFYRLSVVRLVVPPLRERVDDIPALVEHFLDTHNYNQGPGGTRKVKGITAGALEKLKAYRFPGNVRELVNTIERAVSFCDADLIGESDLPDHIRTADGAVRPVRSPSQSEREADSDELAGELADDGTFKEAKERWVSSFERDYILKLLKKNGGNISHAAREADIDRKYFRKLMKKYGIDGSDY